MLLYVAHVCLCLQASYPLFKLNVSAAAVTSTSAALTLTCTCTVSSRAPSSQRTSHPQSTLCVAMCRRCIHRRPKRVAVGGAGSGTGHLPRSGRLATLLLPAAQSHDGTRQSVCSRIILLKVYEGGHISYSLTVHGVCAAALSGQAVPESPLRVTVASTADGALGPHESVQDTKWTKRLCEDCQKVRLLLSGPAPKTRVYWVLRC